MGSDLDQPTLSLLESKEEVDAMVVGVAALAEPVRRSIYRFVVAHRTSLNRDEVAAGVGVARHIAKFHLDKLVEDGLLEFDFRRPPGRSGPGAGRPAKHYRMAPAELFVSVPARRYEFAGQLLARAIAVAYEEGVPVLEALHQAATEHGRLLGKVAVERAGSRPTRRSLERAIRLVLEDAGYEPRDEDDAVILANCPFHSLAQEHTDLVCNMNLDLLEGLLSVLDRAHLIATLDPSPGQCCVRLRRT